MNIIKILKSIFYVFFWRSLKLLGQNKIPMNPLIIKQNDALHYDF